MKKLSYTCAFMMVLLSFSTDRVRGAVEAEKPKLDSDRMTVKLLERIDQLEKRVAELEKQRLRQKTLTPDRNFQLSRKPALGLLRQPEFRHPHTHMAGKHKRLTG